MKLMESNPVQEAQWLFRAMFEQSAVGIAYVALDGQLLRVNQRFCDIIGYPSEEMLTHTFQSITHPDDLSSDTAAFQTMLIGELQTYKTEKRYIRKDGSSIWTHLTTSLIQESDGAPRHFITIIEDISARKHAEEERIQLLVREQAAREEALAHAHQLEAIFEAMTDAVFVHDREGAIIHMNAAARELLPLEAEADYCLRVQKGYGNFLEVYDKSGKHFSEDEWPLTRMLRGEVLKGASAVDIVVQLPSGERHFRISGAAMRDAEGHILGAVSLMSDVTEQWRIEQSLRTANQHMDSFLSIVGHELKSPLTAIKGNIQLTARHLKMAIATQRKGASESYEGLIPVLNWLDVANQQVSRVDRLVSDLLDISRIQVGKMNVYLEPCNLADVVCVAVETQRVSHPKRVIDVHIQPQDECVVLADADRIEQVVTNYLSNAVRYTPAEKPIVVTIERQATQVMVSVHDAGYGIPSDEYELIWERYRQAADGNAQGRSKGLGLGLYISKMIIQLHHGQVGVRSVMGQGTTFWFALPLAAPVDVC